MVETRNLSYSHPGHEMRFPDFRVASGETLLITGNSGAGKTTLLHLLGGLLEPQSGSVEIGGTDLGALTGRQRDRFRGNAIGIVLQEQHFISSLSVLENLTAAGWFATGKKMESRAKSLLAELGLENQSYKKPNQLSVGQQQRVSIARALISEPKLILADEPTSGLDDANALSVAKMLSHIAQAHRSALVIVTHDQRLKEIFTKSIALC